jgi:hypothetical protein
MPFPLLDAGRQPRPPSPIHRTTFQGEYAQIPPSASRGTSHSLGSIFDGRAFCGKVELFRLGRSSTIRER